MPNGTANVRAKAFLCSANVLPDLASAARVFAAEPVAVRQWEQVIALHFPTAYALFCVTSRVRDAHTSAQLSALGPAQLRQTLARLGSRLSQRRGDYLRYSLFSP